MQSFQNTSDPDDFKMENAVSREPVSSGLSRHNAELRLDFLEISDLPTRNICTYCPQQSGKSQCFFSKLDKTFKNVNLDRFPGIKIGMCFARVCSENTCYWLRSHVILADDSVCFDFGIS